MKFLFAEVKEERERNGASLNGKCGKMGREGMDFSLA